MKKAIRCCISCILPCGSLDVIRIVHANGRVEEISGTIRACEVMKAYPKHVLKKPSSSSSSIEQGNPCCDQKPRILILPPDAQLERGKIYFLMPVPVPPRSKRRSGGDCVAEEKSTKHERRRRMTDQYLSELLSEEKLSRRRGRVGVWRPRLESICE